MTNRCDVCVIGAGPAGVAAAITLCRGGRTVVLVEAGPHARPRPGEHLAPDTLAALPALGVAAGELAGIAEPSPGRVVAWGGPIAETSYLFHPAAHALNVDRCRFDALLARHAVAAGAELHAGSRVTSSSRESGRWVLSVGGGGAQSTVRAGLVLDATGRRAAFARTQGARTLRRDGLIAALTMLDGHRGMDRRLVVEATPDGWWYSVPVLVGTGSCRLVLAWVTDPPRLRAAGGPAAVVGHALASTELTRSRVVDSTSPVGDVLVLAAGSGFCEPTTGAGWLAIGDAAPHVDPLWGRGVPHAVDLGLRAAEAALVEPGHHRQILPVYAEAVQQRWLAAERTRHDLYRQGADRLGSPFWRERAACLERTSSRGADGPS